MKSIEFLRTITEEENIEEMMYGIFVKDGCLLKEDIAKLIECEDFASIQGSINEDVLYIGINPKRGA